MSLHKADIEIRKILVKCEEEGDNFDVTLNKVSRVKVYGVVFPTLMLMEIIDEYSSKREERERAKFKPETTDAELQNKYQEASRKWNDGN
tara:strand:- start:194 stop:463 length:270 start_codon:yes stop_codon:yes gene_type:complete